MMHIGIDTVALHGAGFTRASKSATRSRPARRSSISISTGLRPAPGVCSRRSSSPTATPRSVIERASGFVKADRDMLFKLALSDGRGPAGDQTGMGRP